MKSHKIYFAKGSSSSNDESLASVVVVVVLVRVIKLHIVLLLTVVLTVGGLWFICSLIQSIKHATLKNAAEKIIFFGVINYFLVRFDIFTWNMSITTSGCFIWNDSLKSWNPVNDICYWTSWKFKKNVDGK